MKKAAKGTVGYVQYQRIRRALIMIVMFAIPLVIYFSALKITGTNRNIMTIVAVVGMIPAARFAVSWIMIMLQRKADPQAVRITQETAGMLTNAFELMVTSYDGRLPLDAVVVCGNEIAAVSVNAEKKQIDMMEKHITKILNSNQYFNSNVRIFPDLKHYQDRIRQLAADPDKYREGIRFTPDERYPNLTRDELVLHTILAICV